MMMEGRRCALLSLLRGYPQFVEIVRTKICQRMSLEPGPEILHRIEVWCVRRQKRDLNVPVGAVEVFANHLRFVRPESIENDQERLFQVSLERLEEFDDLFFLDASLVETEQAVYSGQSGNHGQVFPVEMELNYWCLPLRCPSAYTGGSLARLFPTRR